ncbi:MAG: YceI family protein [Brumimicrobium sp.]
MKKSILFTSLLFGLLVTSCNESENKDGDDAKVEVKEVENCIYTFNDANTKLDWTAYKFTRKAGVGGTFTKLQVDGKLKGAEVKKIIESLSFSIPTSTIETNDPSRNKKIDSLFFNNLESTEMITGKVVSLGDDGNATLMIKMNNIEREVSGDYTLEDNKFTYKTEINLNDWEAKKQLNTLNVACKDLHTDVENGETESVLWPDVSISFSTELSKACD